ncbi:MAG: sigma-70 family RNA polymerase sigma factor, partial [Verrucomicrobiota bacterium]
MKRMNDAAWNEFHRRYFSRLCAYALVVLGEKASAEDCVQQTFLRVVRHIRCFDREEVFWSWLTCLVRCAAIDLGRAGKRRSRLAERFAQWREFRHTDPSAG